MRSIRRYNEGVSTLLRLPFTLALFFPTIVLILSVFTISEKLGDRRPRWTLRLLM